MSSAVLSCVETWSFARKLSSMQPAEGVRSHRQSVAIFAPARASVWTFTLVAGTVGSMTTLERVAAYIEAKRDGVC
jgi:hypothetical protein